VPNTNRAPALDPDPTSEELLAASRSGLSLIAYRARKAGTLAPDDRTEDRLEKAEQLECWKVFRAFGGRVYSLSQSRASKQTPGLGDGFVVFPGRVSFWWESKRQKGGVVSPAQQEFHELCAGADGSKHYIGGRREAEEMVIALGIATRGEDGGLYPVRGAPG
jgi:hypothetical protein